jgi:hypothetical protein
MRTVRAVEVCSASAIATPDSVRFQGNMEELSIYSLDYVSSPRENQGLSECHTKRRRYKSGKPEFLSITQGLQSSVKRPPKNSCNIYNSTTSKGRYIEG